jgi:hypothetical protein
MFRSIREDHTNCLQVAIKTHSFIPSGPPSKVTQLKELPKSDVLFPSKSDEESRRAWSSVHLESGVRQSFWILEYRKWLRPNGYRSKYTILTKNNEYLRTFQNPGPRTPGEVVLC